MVPDIMGTQGGLKKLTEQERQLQAFQMDASGFFAGLVDYAAKGSKAELIKDAKEGDTYKLKLTMKSGQEIIYHISKATNLVTRVDTKGTMAASMSGMGAMMSEIGGGRADKMEVTTLYDAYKDFAGIKIPTKVTIKSQIGDSESVITNVKVNEAIDSKLYKAE
jgi:hypothetical protein